ncbi:MAG: hypothetical protein Q7T37_00400 [bacterium]|nr:hypothetical protein [bacterium]MDO8742532.1 hypothetical protein [bacterium]
MNEWPKIKNELPTTKIEKELREGWIVALAIEIIESHEVFHFSGLDSDAYAKIKADEEESPGYATPIDELVKRFENEGMKVVLGKNPESGNVFILPLQSDDIENDSVFPKHLQISEGMNEKLKELILLSKG